MYKIKDFSRLDFINIVDGVRLGPVKDVHFDVNTGKVSALVLKGAKKYFGFLGIGPEVVIPLEKIRKIGADTVLVEIETTYQRKKS